MSTFQPIYRFMKMPGSCALFNNLKTIQPAAPSLCAAQCEVTDGCVGFTFYTDAKMYPGNMCRLRAKRCQVYKNTDINVRYWAML